MGTAALGIDHLTAIGMPPVDLIQLAEAAGLQSISLMTHRNYNPYGFADWSLVDDARLRRETRAALAGSGVQLALGEACHIRPDATARDFEPVIAMFAELGCPRMNVVSFEYEPVREAEQAHELAEMICAAGLTFNWEFSRLGRRMLADVAREVRAMRARGLAAHILIDPMHFIRGGEQIANLAALEPELVSYFQLCDVPLVGEGEYMEEALYCRLPQGDGELPLAEIVRALPEGAVISMEIPQRSRIEAGESFIDMVRDAAAKSRALLAEALGG